MEEVLYGIFLDIHKAYDALDCGRCLNILVAYSVVPRALRLLHRYWDRLLMATRTDGYCGFPFKGHPGMTHGYLLSPTILKMVVDTVFQN